MSVNSGIDRFDHSVSLRLRHVGGICKESNNGRGCILALLPGDYPRIADAGPGHVRLLAESEAALPPILVQRSTLKVVDGMHRLRAALLRGESESRSDREAANRGRSALPEAPVVTRVGADGRMRPVDAAEGRPRAAEILSARPEASLREAARASGIAVGTARDVRERMGRGEDPIPVRQQRGCDRLRAASMARKGRVSVRPAGPKDYLAILHVLKRDPSLRFTDAGCGVLRWLDVHAIGSNDWENLVGRLPSHCATAVADSARHCAAAWKELADRLERRDLDARDEPA